MDDSFSRFADHLFCVLAQHYLFSTCTDIYHCLCNGWKWASMVCKWKYHTSLPCKCWSYHDHAPYLDLAFSIILSMSSSIILTEDNLSFVLKDKVRGSWLLLLIKEHWFAKNELNSSTFFLKSVIYSLFSNSGGIRGIFCQ